ncbi:MAG TPA: helix-turn-helix domain-containing protein [Thermoanaerobaculia bacterium]|nr:helix-turn-helix domain-containing protein [Thermoanaerobaculia bacterium]
MRDPADSLRFILGLKLKNLRLHRGLSLKNVAARAGLSISYLSEIEKGKKYPKPERLLDLARALEVGYDELVSQRVTDELAPLTDLFGSAYLQEFPFELFGTAAPELVSSIGDEPGRVAALLGTLAEVGHRYDIDLGELLLAALRSYQHLHQNHFPELEKAAVEFRRAQGWTVRTRLTPERLADVLEREHGYENDDETLERHPLLSGFRSIYAEGNPPRLFVNGRLLREQQAFLLARELGYRALGLEERAITSTWIQVTSFEQILNNFRASYFAGALLIDRDSLIRRLERLFAERRWNPQAFLDCMVQTRSTPEMFFHRLTEVLPSAFGMEQLYFIRFSRTGPGGRAPGLFRLTKMLNLSKIPLPQGEGLGEHFCRRWAALRILDTLAADPPHRADEPILASRRTRFLGYDQEFFVVSMARPLALDSDLLSSVTLGVRIDDAFRRRVRFADDPAVPREEVGFTCERCPLSPQECVERVAPPVLLDKRRDQAALAAAVERFVRDQGGGG